MGNEKKNEDAGLKPGPTLSRRYKGWGKKADGQEWLSRPPRYSAEGVTFSA